MLVDAVDAGGLLEVAGRLTQTLTPPFSFSGREAFVRASAGIALVEGTYENPEDILRDADIAMYRAKADGRDRCQIFHAALRDAAIGVADLETDLRLALERREFALVYQPIVALADGTVHGFEALLRWRHPTRGLLAPGEFIAALEETGLIVPVGERIVTEACRQLRVWQERFGGNHPLTIGINVSAKQLSGGRFATHLERTLGETGLAAGDVHIELTESAVMEDMAESLAALARLRAIGVELHIDDFGTGYSSLSYLRQLQVDRVKIDRSFVSRDGQNRLADREIIDTIVSLSHKLGIEVVAEGVESEQQRLELRALRCRYAQGYFFARPLDDAAAYAYLTAALHEAAVS